MFHNEGNYAFFLLKCKQYLSNVLDIYAWRLLSNHFHLLIRIKEIEENKVAVRKHGENNSETIATEEFIEDIYNKIITKSI